MAVFMSRQAEFKDRVNYVEYIKSNGSQWIDLLRVATANTVLVADISVNDTSTVRNLCGATDGVYLFNTTSVNSIQYYYGNSTGGISTGSTYINSRFTFEIGASGFKVNGETKAVPNFTSFNNSTNILFLTRQEGPASARGHVTIYGIKIYDNGTIVRDLRPCYDPSGVACLYDKVTESYFYNKGTGEFVAGGAAT